MQVLVHKLEMIACTSIWICVPNSVYMYTVQPLKWNTLRSTTCTYPEFSVQNGNCYFFISHRYRML